MMNAKKNFVIIVKLLVILIMMMTLLMMTSVCAAKDGDDKKTMQRESRAKKLIGCLGVCKTATFAMQRIQYASLTHGALQLHAVAAVTLAHIN